MDPAAQSQPQIHSGEYILWHISFSLRWKKKRRGAELLEYVFTSRLCTNSSQSVAIPEYRVCPDSPRLLKSNVLVTDSRGLLLKRCYSNFSIRKYVKRWKIVLANVDTGVSFIFIPSMWHSVLVWGVMTESWGKWTGWRVTLAVDGRE